MALGAEAEVALAQGLLSKACHALGRITRWKAALKLHVQVMEVQDVKTLPHRVGGLVAMEHLQSELWIGNEGKDQNMFSLKERHKCNRGNITGF